MGWLMSRMSAKDKKWPWVNEQGRHAWEMPTHCTENTEQEVNAWHCKCLENAKGWGN